MITKPKVVKGSSVSNNRLTVGYGLTDPVLINKYKNGISEKDASIELKSHLNKHILPELRKQSWWKNVPDNTKGAIIDIAYSVGTNKFLNKSPNLMRLLKKDSSNVDGYLSQLKYDYDSTSGLGDRSGARMAYSVGEYDKNYTPYKGEYKR